MPFLRNLVFHPRRLWLRRAVFQVHLWVGVALSLYLVVIALTGAALVFEDELTRLTLPPGLSAFQPARTAPLAEVLANLARQAPGRTVTEATFPSPAIPAFQLTTTDAAHHELRFVADPQTGVVLAQPRSLVTTIHDLHVDLLLGPRLGLLLNGLGAAALLLLSLTGVVLWWPGPYLILRRLVVNPRARWRRLNFDLHNALGMWTLALVSWWALSGVYFTWYRQVAAAINFVSPLHAMIAPKPAALPPPPPGAHASLAAVLAAAHAASPRARLTSLSNPGLDTPQLYAEMDLRAPGDFMHRDIVTLRAADARVLSIWHYGRHQSLGDLVLVSMHPLHFGTLWGLPFKILWCAAGLALAVLTLTGLLLYWNRFLSHRWCALRPNKGEAVAPPLQV